VPLRRGWCLCFLLGTLAVAPAALSIAAEPPAQDSQRVELSQQQIETRVKAEAARRFGVEAEEVRLVDVKARVWPDAGLGCHARRGVFEPSPVPGFRIVAEADGRRLVYHTDRRGRLLRCATPTKPTDPIK
jgi:hypothetical protein